MKKFLTIILALVSLQGFAQNIITAINITLPQNPDGIIANWGTGTSPFVITASTRTNGGKVDPAIEESKILVVIKRNGSIVCGSYTASSAPAAEFNAPVKVWSGNNAISLLGKDCTLPPGDYELSVQFWGDGAAGIVPLSDEKIKPFTIKGNDQQNYQAPQAISPAGQTEFKDADIMKPITFRWTPVIPRPQEPVSYRLTIWQLMQGQTGSQAIKANQPIIIKDVDNITQAIITNLITGPCKPPYLCDFIWNVQALNRDGKPLGGNNGTSETMSFKFDVSSNTSTGSVVKLLSPADGSTVNAGESLKFTWQGAPQGTASYSVKIVEVAHGQPAEQACCRPYFEKDTIKGFVFNPSGKLNFVPGATYEWTVYAIGKDGKQLGGDNGSAAPMTFKIDISSNASADSTNLLVELVSPLGSKQAGQSPDFQWKVNNPAPGQTYSLKVIEIHDRQSPGEAINSNTPVVEVSGIKQTSIPYPGAAKPLDTGKTYIWGVTVSDANGKQLGGAFTKLLPATLSTAVPVLLCNLPLNINPNPVTVCQGQQATIQISSTVTGFSWQISGPNGVSQSGTSSGTTQPVTFSPPSSPGSYTYTVNIGKTNVIFIPPFFHFYQHFFCSANVTVNVVPQLNVTINKTQICNGQDAQLNIPNLPAGNTVNWLWRDGSGPWTSLGSGNPINTNAIIASCNGSQNFVTRTFEAQVPGWSSGCAAPVVTLKVWCPTTAGNITPVGNICSGGHYPISFPLTLNGPIVANTYAWSYSGPAGANFSSPNTLNPGTFTLHSAGTYVISVTLTNGTCTSITRSVTVIVEDPLTATIGGNKTEVCPNDDANLYLTSPVPPGAIIKWQYQVNCTGPWTSTTVTGNTQNTNAIGNMGPYPIPPTTSLCWRAIVSSQLGICPPVTSAPYTINIIQAPCMPVITAAGPLPKCPGQPVTLNASTACGTGPFTWQWYLNGIMIGTGQSIAATLPGNYTVEVFNKNQCDSRVSAPFKVTDCVTTVTIAGPCTSNGTAAVTLTASASSQPNPLPQTNPACGGPYSYLWSTGATTASIQVTPATTTVYSVTVTSGNGAATDCSTTASFTVKVCQ